MGMSSDDSVFDFLNTEHWKSKHSSPKSPPFQISSLQVECFRWLLLFRRSHIFGKKLNFQMKVCLPEPSFESIIDRLSMSSAYLRFLSFANIPCLAGKESDQGNIFPFLVIALRRGPVLFCFCFRFCFVGESNGQIESKQEYYSSAKC